MWHGAFDVSSVPSVSVRVPEPQHNTERMLLRAYNVHQYPVD